MLRLKPSLVLKPILLNSPSRSFLPSSASNSRSQLSPLSSHPHIAPSFLNRSVSSYLSIPQCLTATTPLSSIPLNWMNVPHHHFSTNSKQKTFQILSQQPASFKDLDDIINSSTESFNEIMFHVDRPIYPMSRVIISIPEVEAKDLLSRDGKSLAVFVNKENETIGVLGIIEAFKDHQTSHEQDNHEKEKVEDHHQSGVHHSEPQIQFLVRGIRRISILKKESTPSNPPVPNSDHENKITGLSEGQTSYKRIVINGCASLIARHPRFIMDHENKKTEGDHENQPNQNQLENSSHESGRNVENSATELSKLTEDQIVDLFYMLYLFSEENHSLNMKFLSTIDTYARIIEVITNQTSSEVRNAFHRSLRRRILAQKRLFRSVFFTDLVEDLLQLTNSKPDSSYSPSSSLSSPPPFPSLPPSTPDERTARRRISRDHRRIKIESNNNPNSNVNQKGSNWNDFIPNLNSLFSPFSNSTSNSTSSQPTSPLSDKEKEREKERETALSRHKQQTLFLVQWPLLTNPLTTQFRTMNQLINNLHLSKDINSFIQNNHTNNRNRPGSQNPANKNPFSPGGIGGFGGIGSPGAPGGMGKGAGMGPEGSEKNRDAKNISEKAKKLKFPPNVKKVYEEEMTKLASMPPSSSEYHVSKSYLDWLTSLPWGVFDPENLDISHAEKVLEEDHYGLEDLKTSILEFISIGNLKGTLKGKVLCFVGPPGTGKTSIGKSIARALGRKFYRFSVGGLSDMSEIKGHRRTYVGALPGKIIHGLKVQQSSNPVILLDEIDKLSRGYHGDPSAALLEVLDPEQNSNFTDHYLDLPYDLSRVLFICTANSTDTISKPLLDRMEVLRLSGYVSSEKVQIAQKYLIPKILEKFGLKEAGYDITLSEAALLSLANEYCREAGIRNLEKKLEAIFRKIALEVARSRDREKEEQEAEKEASSKKDTAGQSESGSIISAQTETIETEEAEERDQDDGQERERGEEEIYRDAKSERERQKRERKAPPKRMELTKKDLVKYLGKARFLSERYYERTPVGVVVGLAWSEMGGSTLYIETVVAPHTDKKISITGKLGEVMQESASLAYTYAKAHLARTQPENDFFVKNSVHMHFPEGAVPKDGPSAGIAIVTSLMSLARNIPIKQELAMTGEVTLTGLVLAVGGIKEKLVAAQRSGIKTVLLPITNKADVYELDRQITQGLEIRFVETYDQVEQFAFEQSQQKDDEKAKTSHNDTNNEPQKDEKDEESDTEYVPPTISSVTF